MRTESWTLNYPPGGEPGEGVLEWGGAGDAERDEGEEGEEEDEAEEEDAGGQEKVVVGGGGGEEEEEEKEKGKEAKEEEKEVEEEEEVYEEEDFEEDFEDEEEVRPSPGVNTLRLWFDVTSPIESLHSTSSLPLRPHLMLLIFSASPAPPPGL